MNTLPIVQDTIDCTLTPKCRLGLLGCSSIQIPGQSAANVAASLDAERRAVIDTAPLGPGQYDLMVIGDYPYKDDDKRTVPFQDEASNFIIDNLTKAGFDLNRVYMTKIIKCCPPRKRRPTVPEINTCRDSHLRREIELIQPKAVMLIGANSLRAFNLNGKGSINSIRGKLFEEQFSGWDDGPVFKIVPTLSPSAFFYKPNERLKARVTHDYLVAKQVTDGLEPEPHFRPKNIHIIDSDDKLDWLVAQCSKAKMLAFDTESALLNYRKCPLLSIQIAWDWDDVAVIPVHKHDPNAPKARQFHVLESFGVEHFQNLKAKLKEIFENTNTVKAAHNFKYDLNVLRWHFGIRPKGFFLDTWVLKHLMDENPPSDLEFCADIELCWGDYSAERRKITGQGKKLKASFDKIPDHILWPYGATDALATFRLASIFSQRLQTEHKNLWTFYLEESEPLIAALAKAEFKGALLDMDVVDALDAEWQQELKDLTAAMKKDSWPDFNPSSNPQVIKAFKALGVLDLYLEDDASASGYSANKKKLQELCDTLEDQKVITFAQNLLTFRNRRKMVSTYINNAKKDLDSDGRLRYQWVQAGPVTGRLACRFFHQIPKIDKERVEDELPIMRDMFVARKGYVYVYGDFSQVELRILALLANDREMLHILDNEGDLHSATTEEFLVPVWQSTDRSKLLNKFNRTEVGKRINFGLAYGSEGYALVKTGKWMDWDGRERQFTWKMLDEGMKSWKARFKGVGDYIDNTPDLVRWQGSVATNVFGRERHFGGQLTHYNDYERGAAERECINYFIQSSAASLTNRTIIAIDRMLMNYNVSEDLVCLVNTVHDSIAYEVREDLVPWFMDAMRKIATRQIPQLQNRSFKLDAGAGKSWTTAEMAT